MTGNFKLGLDIGRVLIATDPLDCTADTSFVGGTLETALATPPFGGMFDAVPQLVKLFDGRVWLVSKARPQVADKTRRWLEHHDFYRRTGVPPDNLQFCLERAQKAEICRDLGITHFIDDRADVLEHLEPVVPHRYLFGPQPPEFTVPEGVVPVVSWPRAVQALREELGAAA